MLHVDVDGLLKLCGVSPQVLGEEADVLAKTLLSLGVVLRRSELHLGACSHRARYDRLCNPISLRAALKFVLQTLNRC